MVSNAYDAEPDALSRAAVGLTAPAARRTPLVRVALYLAAWLPLLALCFVAMASDPRGLGAALLFALANVLPHVLLGGLVLRVPRLLPWPGQGGTRTWLLHAALGAGYALVALGVWVLLVGVVRLVLDGSFEPAVDPRIVPWQFLMNALIFSALAGLAHAWHHAERAAREANRAARAETLRAVAELAALRSQLNPHFIFNTLHVVLGLVRHAPELAEAAIERLADLLRFGLRIQREGLDEVALREEWAFVESYLALERLRLGERLRLDASVQAAALEQRVPCFALQTLVENAVRHAVAPRAAGGVLAIRAACDGDRLRIVVQDDGRGVSDALASAPGRGLSLLRERLTALHGGAAQLVLEPAHGGGLRAVLELPLAARSRDDGR